MKSLDKGKRKQSVGAIENPPPEHYLKERTWFCWLTENPTAYLEHPQALDDLKRYDSDLWDDYCQKITQRFEKRLRDPTDFVGLSFLVCPFAGLLLGYSLVSDHERYAEERTEHTLGKYVPFIGPLPETHATSRARPFVGVDPHGPQPHGHLERKEMPRRKSYVKRSKRLLPSVWPRSATGQSAGEHLKTRIWGLMLDDLARAGLSRHRAIDLIADVWDIADFNSTPDPESVRRSLLRIRPIK